LNGPGKFIAGLEECGVLGGLVPAGTLYGSKVLAMEEKFGAKWRKNVRGGAKHMSRLKAVMRAIADMTALEGGSVDPSIGVLDDVFQDKGVDGGKNKRLSNLVDIFKSKVSWPRRRLTGLVGEGWASASV
jgi:hypothetical protein